MSESENRYFIVHKPVNMVSQFVSTDKVRLLGDLDFSFPEGTHAIGRLDSKSEGILILTTNKKVTRLLFQGDQLHTRTYLVQVNYTITENSLERLRNGVKIRIRGGGYYITSPCQVEAVDNPEIYLGQQIKKDTYALSSWLLINLTEGKYHQVRKMITAAGHRCKRLVRVSIENIKLENLKPGEVREMDERSFFENLKIANW